MGIEFLIIIFIVQVIVLTSLLVGHEGSAVSISGEWSVCRVRTRDPIFSYIDPEDDPMGTRRYSRDSVF